MTSSFDAEDMMKRGLLSSLMGFKKRVSTAKQSANAPQNQPACSSSQSVPVCTRPAQLQITVAQQIETDPLDERTPFDIYREIVTEAEQLERSNTATPLSEFDCTSPLPMNMNSPVNNQFGGPQMPFVPQVLGPPPAYTGPIPFVGNVQYPPMSMQIHNQLPQGVKQETIEQKLLSNLNAQVTLEEFVKLVVTAVRESGETREEESPEEILKRKRQQNNEAAARYRKRQREAKDKADSELSDLVDKNNSLKSTIEQMQKEIEMLKKAVLNGGSA